MEDLSSITPGFCPNCGSILPHLRPTGKVRCYNCLTDWPPEGMCYSRSTGPMVPFLTILTISFQSNWETAVLFFSFFLLQLLTIITWYSFQFLVQWKRNSQYISTHTRRESRLLWSKMRTKARLLREFVPNVETKRCRMPRYSWEVRMKVKRCFTHVRLASMSYCYGGVPT